MSNEDQLINKFLEKIKFNNEDKEDVILRLKLKGVYFYSKIYDFIILNKKEPNIEHILSIYIYDKRIRYVLFKYICMIEEQYRAKIINNIENGEKNIIKKTFKKLIEELIKRKIINDNYRKKIEKIRNLRNEVFHNNFIILEWKNPIVKRNEKLLKTMNLIKELLINDEIKQQFICDIIYCSKKEKSKKYKNKIKYILINEIQIKYENGKFKF